MKKLFLIMGLCLLMIIPLSAKKVVVLKVSKNGNGWQNIFNMYGSVTTTYVGEENGITYVNVNCDGEGFTFCRASRQIGAQSTGNANTDDVLGNAQIVRVINNLIEESEIAFNSKGTLKGAKSSKVAIVRGDKTQLYYVNAQWQYRTGPNAEAKITITIETDENSLINRRQ